MFRILIVIIVASVIWIINFNQNSHAEEIILCINVVDEEVNLMDARGNCLEEEREVTFSGLSLEDRDRIIPLANFSSNKDCETRGNRIELGFDKDDDGILDSEEIVSLSEDCETSSEGE